VSEPPKPRRPASLADDAYKRAVDAHKRAVQVHEESVNRRDFGVKDTGAPLPNAPGTPSIDGEPIAPLSRESIGFKADGKNTQHYMPRAGSRFNIEAIEAIEAAVGNAFPEFCRAQIIGLIWRAGRHGDANGVKTLIDDLREAAWFLHKWLEYEGHNE